MLKKLKEIRNSLTELQWHHKFEKMHPELSNYEGDASRLRLILGTARSGTSWVVKTLSQTSTPIRYFHEPIWRINPKFSFTVQRFPRRFIDHTAIEYCPTLPQGHPLLRGYLSLTAPNYNWSALGLKNQLVRNDSDWQFCLVKEVHSLLATEALLKSFNCLTVLIVRDPLYMIDSKFASRTRNFRVPYLNREFKAVRDPAFLERFAPRQAKSVAKVLGKVSSIREVRERSILQKVLTAAIIRLMLRVLASEYKCAYLVEYEELCQSPYSIFTSMAKFLTLDYEETMEQFLVKATSSNPEKDNPDSVFRETSKQVDRPFKFLRPQEVSLCRQVLSDSELAI